MWIVAIWSFCWTLRMKRMVSQGDIRIQDLRQLGHRFTRGCSRINVASNAVRFNRSAPGIWTSVSTCGSAALGIQSCLTMYIHTRVYIYIYIIIQYYTYSLYSFMQHQMIDDPILFDRLNMTQSTKMERGFVFLWSQRLLSHFYFLRLRSCDLHMTCIGLAYDLHMMHSCPGSLAPMGWPKACATWAQWQWASTVSTVTNFQENQCKSKARAVFVLPEKHGTRRKIM